MNVLAWIFEQRRMVLFASLFLSFFGFFMWMTMVRQEDPRLPDFWAMVQAPFPGADALTVERLVLEPMEDALAEVAEIKYFEATAYDEIAVMNIELRGDVSDYADAWDEVRQALDRASLEFPQGAGQPVLDDNQMDQDSIVLAVTGSTDPIMLLNAARRLKDHLQQLSYVKRAHLVAEPQEQITIALNDETARRLGITSQHLAAQISARNRILSGGSLQLKGKTLRLRPLSEFLSISEIESTPIRLPYGSTIPLGEVARVYLGPREPMSSRMRINGEMAVGVAAIPSESINLVSFGETVRTRINTIRPSIAPLRIEIVTFQPDRTRQRLTELNRSLLFGILIVAGILIMTMGIRLGLVISAVVPLVAMTAVAVFAWGGGVLHQISISALVLALGMLVDNAIVMSENIQWRLDHGEDPFKAALEAARELAVPLAGATLTTIAAFVPMMIAKGPTAAFTRAIPIVIIMTISISYLYALFVTPVVSQMVLKPGNTNGGRIFIGLGNQVSKLAVNRPVLVVIFAVIILTFTLLATRYVPRQFFPAADRNQILIDVKMPEGTHLNATDATVALVERALARHKEVLETASFMGRSAPKFYYNVPSVPFSPHFAQIIVKTSHVEANDHVLNFIRQQLAAQISDAELVARELEQGPPVQAPVEIRLSSDNLDELNQAAGNVAGVLKSIYGTTDVRHNMGPGVPTLRFRIDDAVASLYGITRADLAKTVYGQTRGIPTGQFRSGEDPIPVVVRSAAGENLPVSDLETIDISNFEGNTVPLGRISQIESVWQPAAVRHRNGRRVVTVSSQLSEGVTYSNIMAELQSKLNRMNLPAGVVLTWGGDLEGSGEANSALMNSLPIGLLLLLGVLLAEFNSFRRMVMILLTVPLAAAGVVPGLLLTRQPFGFMSFLGVIALVGIVVNNAIVLLEVVEAQRRQGANIPTALKEAIVRRIRPILLTTATTVAGLLPLALSSSTLWPPLASAMISGLLASTLLTLLVVPAIYRLLMQPLRIPRFSSFRKAKQFSIGISAFVAVLLI